MAPILLASGSNASAQLSLGHSSDVHSFTPCQFHPSIEHLLPGAEILDLASASTHALLLLRDSHGSRWVLGAGTNSLGQLGPRCALWDDIKPEPRFKPVDPLPLGASGDDWEPVCIAVTWTTSFVVYRNKSAREGGTGEEAGGRDMVVACGSNDFGELGIPAGEQGHIAVTSASDLPSVVPLDLEPGDNVERIKGGQRHVIAVIKDAAGAQRVVGWGASRKGELNPASPSTSSSAPAPIAAGRKGKGKATAIPPTSPPISIELPIPPGERIIDIALGASHSLALLSNGTVLAWGSDLKGQIHDAHTLRDVTQIAATWGGSYFLLCPLDRPTMIVSQGANNYSQLLRPGHPPQGAVDLGKMEVRKLAAGSEHLVVAGTLQQADGVWVGGWNEHGNLGLDDTADRDRLTGVDLSGHGDKRIKGVWGGCAATWIWLEG